MQVIEERGCPDLATVFIARLGDGELIEFVESVQPPVHREEKLVFILSTLKGCPVSCVMCDAGIRYGGMLSTDEMMSQIEYLVDRNFPDHVIPVRKLKIQFARMGDPAFNTSVITVLERLPGMFDAPGLMPCISTIAPSGTDTFFEKLTRVKNRFYSGGRFQMQFSLHTSCERARRSLIPAATWSYKRMSEWGNEFYTPGDRKIALNFAPVEGYPLDPSVIASTFSTDVFMVKLTPVNPTRTSANEGIRGVIDPFIPSVSEEIVNGFLAKGFDTILSIGELRENQIGSNCGMFVSAVTEGMEAAVGGSR